MSHPSGTRTAALAGGALSVMILIWLLTRGGLSPTLPTDASPPPTVGALSDSRPVLAVLPFTNRGGTDEDRNFVDGMHDELRTNLSRIPGLMVLSRASVEEFRNSPRGAREMGDVLGSDYVLEGGVQRAGGRLRLTLQLIDASDGSQVWGDSYNRQLTTENIFDIQSAVARSVAGQLGAAISEAQASQIAERSTGSLRAYEYYLRGFRMSNELVELPRQQVAEAQRLLEAAVEEDQDFALAYAALSNVHSWHVLRRWDFSPNRRQAARDAAERALELAPGLPEAYLAQAMYAYRVDQDYDNALDSLVLAEPGLRGDAVVALQRAYIERRAGRFQAALRSLERARELDPRSEVPYRQIGHTLMFLRRYDEAASTYEAGMELERTSETDRLRLDHYRARVALFRDGDTGPLREWLEAQPDDPIRDTVDFRALVDRFDSSPDAEAGAAR